MSTRRQPAKRCFGADSQKVKCQSSGLWIMCCIGAGLLGVTQTTGNQDAGHHSYIQQHNSQLSDSETAYCNPLDGPIHGKEGLVSSRFTLRSVHLVIRHGARNTDEHIDNIQIPVLSCRWPIPHYAAYNQQVTSFIQAMDELYESEGPGSDHTSSKGLYPDQDVCEDGQLTWIGILQLFRLGKLLRERYIDNIELLPEVPNVEDLYVRTTDSSRTFQSSHAILFNLFPRLDLSLLPVDVVDMTSLCSEERSGLSCSCSMIDTLHDQYDEKKPSLADDVNVATAEVLGVETDDLPMMSDLIDVLMTYVCFGENRPCNSHEPSQCFTQSLQQSIWEDSARRRKETLDIPEFISYHSLSIYPLLYEMLQNMRRTSQGSPQPRFVLYSGHDTTLQSLAVALGFSTGEKPSFASRFAMELYSDQHDEFFLRIINDGHDVTQQPTKLCGDDDLVDGLCPLNNFETFLSDELLKGEDSYSEAC